MFHRRFARMSEKNLGANLSDWESNMPQNLRESRIQESLDFGGMACSEMPLNYNCTMNEFIIFSNYYYYFCYSVRLHYLGNIMIPKFLILLFTCYKHLH